MLLLYIDYRVPKTEAGIKQCQVFCAKNPKCSTFTFNFARNAKNTCTLRGTACKKIRPATAKYTYQKMFNKSKFS